MRGIGPDWARDPHCRLRTDITYLTGPFASQVKTVDVSFGEEAGETFRTEINPNRGRAYAMVQAGYTNPYRNELRPQASYATEAYFDVP